MEETQRHAGESAHHRASPRATLHRQVPGGHGARLRADAHPAGPSYAVFHIFTPLSLSRYWGFPPLCRGWRSYRHAHRFGGAYARFGELDRRFLHHGQRHAGRNILHTDQRYLHLYAEPLPINSYANEAFKTLIARNGTFGDILLPLAVLAGVDAVVALLISRRLFSAVSGKR